MSDENPENWITNRLYRLFDGCVERVEARTTMLGGGYDFTVISRTGKRADWHMVAKDFDYTDDEIVQKFVNPIRSVLV